MSLPAPASPTAVNELAEWRRSRDEALVAPQGNLALVETRWYDPDTEIPASDLTDAAGGSVTVTTLERTDLDTGLPQRGLRRWDADSPAISAFDGVAAYGYDPEWVIDGQYVPGHDDRTVSFEHLRDNGRTRELAVPGEILTTIGGTEYRLNAFDDGGVLLLVFGDPTNGAETYASGRFLFVDRSADEFGTGGAVTLDFNRAFVPPCGFSDQYNCPLPPASNRIAVPVRAGEQLPRFAAGFEH
ncbi:DUF1684 domain-containing protein [Gryllotalpicola reticulitermitis]|uniref:DUF1684 domain-containing protein n=1 Tax=Gryllotalpicola reticulitermitis TaxID=1184153 RepID=A0ABV8Q6I4_9MICO